MLREHFGIREADPPTVIRERLGDWPHLGLTLGLLGGEKLHPLVARDRLHDAWASFLGELAADHPLVLLIEDVHWADDDLLDLLDSLVSQVDAPILVLVTTRPELLGRRPSWQGASESRTGVSLEALPATDAAEMLRELLGCEPPASVRDAVVARSEGNPFFVEELLATLIDRGVLARQNGGWSCAELPEGFAIPDTVQAVLSARIDLLPEAEKAALQAGAVIGRVFWTGPVYGARRTRPLTCLVTRCTQCGHENPPEARFCMACGGPLGELREERKVVSVVFCDLVDSTTAAHAAGPEDVRKAMRSYRERQRGDPAVRRCR